ncbi:hypothetical protein EG328_003442 [Venturia inaequalis]|uniref:TLC domain-containing protein n=1 Tax=Venturia inaequalis TaxID=5025 RepID=A0A8H3YX66_VENIN|nr:hypothetical protein EG328_003442 [Venturia inaequalis]
MRYPFPFECPNWLIALVTPTCQRLGLYTLPYHIHEVIFAASFYTFVQKVVSPWLSPKLFPNHYPQHSARTRFNWDVHVVSFVQSVLVCTMALYEMAYDEERKEMDWQERAWGYTGGTGLIEAFGCGYFLWDLIVTALNYSMYGFGTLAHALSAITVYGFGFRPFVNYYAPDFILYELSSPFLNIHWFCDKLNKTGSTVQLINGIFLLTSFFLARLVWGTYASFSISRDCLMAFRFHQKGLHHITPIISPNNVMTYAAQREAPLWLVASFSLSNTTLNILNWYWFRQMVSTIRKRFPAPWGTMKVEEKTKEEPIKVEMSTGYENGHKSLEVDATHVRKRPQVERTTTGKSDAGPSFT